MKTTKQVTCYGLPTKHRLKITMSCTHGHRHGLVSSFDALRCVCCAKRLCDS